MTAQDLISIDMMGEKYDLLKNELLSKEVVLFVVRQFPEYNQYFFSGIISSFSNALFMLCAQMKYDGKEADILQILHECDACNDAFIHNATYLLQRLFSFSSKNISLIGIKSVNLKENTYILDTFRGPILLQKAHSLFQNTNSSYIFKRQLAGQCYIRTYDFIKENPNYTAVLAYMPNLLYGGHYHTYLEQDNFTLDIAADCFYDSKTSSNKVLNGRIIKKLSLEEIEGYYNEMIQSNSKIAEIGDKLHILALRFDGETKDDWA